MTYVKLKNLFEDYKYWPSLLNDINGILNWDMAIIYATKIKKSAC